MLNPLSYIKCRSLKVVMILTLYTLSIVLADDQPQRTTPLQLTISHDINRLALPTRTNNSTTATGFVNPTDIAYPFPSKGRNLPEGVYWQITGHDNGSKRRDMSATRFDSGTGKWTRSHPASAGFEGDANSLIWNVPVYAPADGIVIGCWRVALDGDDPAEAGCGDNPADPTAPCQRPGGGNHVWLWIPDQSRLLLLAHFRQDSVPEHICSHGRTIIANAKDKTGPFGLTPELANPFPWPTVKKGDFLGKVGNSGKSSGPHLHIQAQKCKTPLTNQKNDCSDVVMRFNEADIAIKPTGRDVRENEWVALNGPLPVTTPRRIVRPYRGIGGVVSPATLSAQQTKTPHLTVVLDVTNPASPVDAFQWKIVEPTTDNVFAEQMRADYTIEGTCPNSVESMTTTTPEASSTQFFPFGTKTVSLNQNLIGTSRADISAFCLDFARAQSENALCSQNPEQCHSHLDTTFAGDSDGSNSVVKLRMECQNGSVLERVIAPQLDLTCGLEPFGFIH